MNKSTNDGVYLGYASENLETVQKIYAGLTKRKLNIWFDEEHLKPGLRKPQIKKAIAGCHTFIICISMAALKASSNKKPGFQDDMLNWAYKTAMAQPDDSHYRTGEA
jgi:hypothetical protein